MGLIDSWMSSVLAGRTVATIADLCFMPLWALMLNLMAQQVGSRFGVVVSWLIVPLIAVAELCSWSAVLTTCYLGNAIEESIWTVTAALLIASAFALWSRSTLRCRQFLAGVVVLGI